VKQSAKLLIIDKDNKILCLRRSKTHPYWPYHLDFPGGIIEKNELPKVGLIREVHEELNLSIKKEDIKLIKKRNQFLGFKVYLFALKLNSTQPKIKLSFEHDQYYWVSVSELKQKKPAMESRWFYKNILKFMEQ
jgi:8-oxo-dGTP diphosphatase